MDVTRIATGLWRWTGHHPEWKQDVGCLYVETDDAVVLVDPLVPPEAPARFLKALDSDVRRTGLPVHVVITVYWHARSSRDLSKRYRARVWSAAAARAAVARRTPVTDTFRPGNALPGGFQAYPTARGTEVILWHPAHRALVPGDVLLGADRRRDLRLCPAGWLRSRSVDDLRASLAPLARLPVERLLVSHGEPVLSGGRRALRRVLGPAG